MNRNRHMQGTETRTCYRNKTIHLVNGTSKVCTYAQTYTVRAGAHTVRKLSVEERNEIREDYRRGVALAVIARRYNIGVKRVKSVCDGEVI